MIKITLRETKSIALKMEPFDSDILKKIKSLPTRKYDNKTYSWIVPLDDVTLVQDKFKPDELAIDKSVEDAIKLTRDEKNARRGEPKTERKDS